MKGSYVRMLTWVWRKIGWLGQSIVKIGSVVGAVVLMWTVYQKYFGPPGELAALKSAVNTRASSRSLSSIDVELVQAPKDQAEDEHVFDIYLRNHSSTDVLLTEVRYGDGYGFAAAYGAQIGSQPFAPNAAYKFPIGSEALQTAALAPPYLLKAGSRGAVRIRFNPGEGRQSLSSTIVAFELLDSNGVVMAAVNAFPPH